MTRRGLLEYFRRLFPSVLKVIITRNGNRKQKISGFGFLAFRSEEEVQEALQRKRFSYKGRCLRVEPYLESGSLKKHRDDLKLRRVFVGKIPRKMTDTELQDILSGVLGPIEHAYGVVNCHDQSHQGFGYAIFEDKETALRAIQLGSIYVGAWDCRLTIEKVNGKKETGKNSCNSKESKNFEKRANGARTGYNRRNEFFSHAQSDSTYVKKGSNSSNGGDGEFHHFSPKNEKRQVKTHRKRTNLWKNNNKNDIKAVETNRINKNRIDLNQNLKNRIRPHTKKRHDVLRPNEHKEEPQPPRGDFNHNLNMAEESGKRGDGRSNPRFSFPNRVTREGGAGEDEYRTRHHPTVGKNGSNSKISRPLESPDQMARKTTQEQDLDNIVPTYPPRLIFRSKMSVCASGSLEKIKTASLRRNKFREYHRSKMILGAKNAQKVISFSLLDHSVYNVRMNPAKSTHKRF